MHFQKAERLVDGDPGQRGVGFALLAVRPERLHATVLEPVEVLAFRIETGFTCLDEAGVELGGGDVEGGVDFAGEGGVGVAAPVDAARRDADARRGEADVGGGGERAEEGFEAMPGQAPGRGAANLHRAAAAVAAREDQGAGGGAEGFGSG